MMLARFFFNKRIPWSRSRSVVPHHAWSADASFSCSPEGASSSPSCWHRLCLLLALPHPAPGLQPTPRESRVSSPKPHVSFTWAIHMTWGPLLSSLVLLILFILQAATTPGSLWLSWTGTGAPFQTLLTSEEMLSHP